MSDSEKDIQSNIMIAVQGAYPKALVIRQNTGAAFDRSGNFVRFGVPGQADIKTIIYGIAVEIEVKTPKGTQSDDQINYQTAVELAGGIYILGRSVTQTMEEIEWKISSMRLSPPWPMQECPPHQS